MRIAYDGTYITRGRTGISRDARNLVNIILNLKPNRFSLILFAKDTHMYLFPNRKNIASKARAIGSAVRYDGIARTFLPLRLRQTLLFLQSFKTSRSIRYFQVNKTQIDSIMNSLHIRAKQTNDLSIEVVDLNYKARLVRPSLLKPFKLMNLDADIFIQQQLDAIRIPKSTAYVVRLHDILPITHPQYFDEISIRAFAKSLHSTFKQNPYVIMDSKSSAIELKTIYGENFSVYNIPPLVDFSYFTEKQVSKKKQIIVLNTLEPRKQTLTAIEGFLNAKYNNMIFKDWKLIVAGSNGWLEESLYENLRQKTFGSDVIFFDTPSDATVCNLFNESSIVMSMSAAEGFGLPPLEGAYFGCLPVVSDIPSHREHLSEIAIFVQDTNPLEISKKLAEAVEKVSLEGDNLQIKLRSHVRDNYGKEKVTNMWKFVLDDIINLHSQSKI